MNNVLTYTLVGAGLVGAYVVAVKLTEPAAQKNGLAQVVDSVSGLVGAFKGKAARLVGSFGKGTADAQASLPGGLTGELGDSPSVMTGEGAAAIADGRGLRKVSGLSTAPQRYMTRAEQTFAGVIDNRFQAIR